MLQVCHFCFDVEVFVGPFSVQSFNLELFNGFNSSFDVSAPVSIGVYLWNL